MRFVVQHGHTTGARRSSTYRSWDSMKLRCLNPKQDSYKYYGGRGIKIAERWLKFANFLADMGPKPSPKHTIDRFPDKDGDYRPGNCRWATVAEQNRNYSRNHLITLGAVTLTVTDHALARGLEPDDVFKRLRRGWDLERAFGPYMRKRRDRKPAAGCSK